MYTCSWLGIVYFHIVSVGHSQRAWRQDCQISWKGRCHTVLKLLWCKCRHLWGSHERWRCHHLGWIKSCIYHRWHTTEQGSTTSIQEQGSERSRKISFCYICKFPHVCHTCRWSLGSSDDFTSVALPVLCCYLCFVEVNTCPVLDVFHSVLSLLVTCRMPLVRPMDLFTCWCPMPYFIFSGHNISLHWQILWLHDHIADFPIFNNLFHPLRPL